MKKSFLALILASFAFAQSALALEYKTYYDETAPEEVQSTLPEHLLTRNSFYVEASVGALAQSVSGSFSGSSDEISRASFSGTGLLLSLDLGMNFRRWFATYIGFDYAGGSSRMSFSGSRDKIKDFDSYTFDFNVGFKVFPLRNTPNLDGMFFGMELGIGSSDADHEDYNYYYTEDFVSVKVMVGNIWRLNDRWGAGVKAFVLFQSFDDEYYDYYSSRRLGGISGTAVGFAVNLIRR
ncbi:MAG: hypothetical protein MJZ25_06695 [Fibrobacter sp.]|nr:hypothetical protein [Fibrobacter sp.]